MDIVQLSDNFVMSSPKRFDVAFASFFAEFATSRPHGLAAEGHAAARLLARGEEVPLHVLEVQVHGRLLVGHALRLVQLLEGLAAEHKVEPGDADVVLVVGVLVEVGQVRAEVVGEDCGLQDGRELPGGTGRTIALKKKFFRRNLRKIN